MQLDKSILVVGGFSAFEDEGYFDTVYELDRFASEWVKKKQVGLWSLTSNDVMSLTGYYIRMTMFLLIVVVPDPVCGPEAAHSHPHPLGAGGLLPWKIVTMTLDNTRSTKHALFIHLCLTLLCCIYST